MKRVKIIIEVDGEMTHLWFTIATKKEIANLEGKLNEVITNDESWKINN